MTSCQACNVFRRGWLREMGKEAGFPGSQMISRLSHPGQCHETRFGSRRISPQLPGELDAVHSRHVEVDEDYDTEVVKAALA